MAPQRRIDVVLDSVRRLLRIGATANLQNLLQKQHPADLGQIFGELHDGERAAAFSILVERQPKLAMESVSELGPERGAALLAGRSAEEIAKLVQEIPSDDAAALVDNLPEELSNEVLELMRKRESGQVESLLDYAEQTAGRIMNPNVFALSEDLTVAEAVSALQNAINVEMVFYLYVVDARRHLVGVTSLRRLLLVAPRQAAVDEQLPGLLHLHVPGLHQEVGNLLHPVAARARRHRDAARVQRHVALLDAHARQRPQRREVLRQPHRGEHHGQLAHVGGAPHLRRPRTERRRPDSSAAGARCPATICESSPMTARCCRTGTSATSSRGGPR